MAEKKEPEHKPAKVDKWDASAVKNALDDAVKMVMKDDFNCEEDHSLMNGRLILSAIGVGFALAGVIWDYMHPFPESRPVLITCVVSYFILMAFLTMYIMYKEKGIIYVGREKDKAGVDPDNIWTFSSAQQKYDDIYQLNIEYEDGLVKGKPRTVELKESVTKFFDEKGTLREDLFKPKLKQICSSLQSEKKSK